MFVYSLFRVQEAVCVGMKAAMRDVDSLTTAYRCHGWAHCWGYSVKSVLAELFGNYDGASLGKGGSMHFYGERFYGGNGIVGAQVDTLLFIVLSCFPKVPVGAGVGFAHKYLGDGGVSFALYGDGASNQGQVMSRRCLS